MVHRSPSPLIAVFVLALVVALLALSGLLGGSGFGRRLWRGGGHLGGWCRLRSEAHGHCYEAARPHLGLGSRVLPRYRAPGRAGVVRLLAGRQVEVGLRDRVAGFVE